MLQCPPSSQTFSCSSSFDTFPPLFIYIYNIYIYYASYLFYKNPSGAAHPQYAVCIFFFCGLLLVIFTISFSVASMALGWSNDCPSFNAATRKNMGKRNTKDHYDNMTRNQSTTKLMDHFVYAPSQWETTLQCNVVSHCSGACIKWPMQNPVHVWWDRPRFLFEISKWHSWADIWYSVPSFRHCPQLPPTVAAGPCHHLIYLILS